MARGYADYEGEKRGLLSEAELAEREGNYVTITGLGADKTFEQSAIALRTVPAGKTLYVTTLTVYCVASNAADADNNQFFEVEVYAPSVATLHLKAGGNGGLVLLLRQPIKVAAAGLFTVYAFSYANHNVDLYITARGYEI